MTYYLKSGARFNVTTNVAVDLREQLPTGTYTVKYDQMTDTYSLEIIDNFEIKGKVYGDTQRNSTRILNTFQDRDGSTGVMLVGEKGSGKTLLAKMISLDGQMQGIPTIVINQPWCGETFNGFMQMIEQPLIVVFDEFEKVYDREDQDRMLTLLDGVYSSKKLFIITSNDNYRINEHMRNRPGRIFYRLDYGGLDNAFIVEYCEDNLKNKEHIDTITRIGMTFAQFNFDILKAMVEEMNRYGETPQEVMKVLNAKPEQDSGALYNIKVTVDGQELPAKRLDSGAKWHGNPLMQPLAIGYWAEGSNQDDDEDENDFKVAQFTISDLKSIEPETGILHFRNENGDEIVMDREKPKAFNWDAY